MQRMKERHVTPYWVAKINTGSGQNDEALKWLEKAYEERSGWLIWLKIDPTLDSLRSDSRFQDLLRRMNFPP